VAQVASQLFYAANNLNVSSSQAGTAMQQAANETYSDPERSTAFRDLALAYFNGALKYDRNDNTARFNLGITYYQTEEDSLAEATFRQVVEATVVPLSKLPGDWQRTLMGTIDSEVAAVGYYRMDAATMASVDSILEPEGYPSGGYGYLFFPELRDKEGFTAATAEDAGAMFLSTHHPSTLEQIELLLGVSQLGVGMKQIDNGDKEKGEAMVTEAIATLKTVLLLNPGNADAWQSLGHCYSKLGQKNKALEAFKKYDELSG
jgi:Flp pilus assembly protein TadD